MSADQALLDLLRLLKAADYHFTTVTPATHARVVARPCETPGLRDIFGWNRPFDERDLDASLLRCLRESDMLENRDRKLRSRVRVASLGDNLLLHSSYPTDGSDSVFLGPDTYRFVRAVREHVQAASPKWIVDMGAGSGAGIISSARRNARLTAVDINPLALRFAAINAEAAGVPIETVHSSEMPPGADLVIANPPYIMDEAQRTYRHGGALFGGEIALDWARQAIERMAHGGTMLLYTGAAVAAGAAPLVEELQKLSFQVEEIDPDVFGEELDRAAYAEVERIAVIVATIRKS